MKIRFISTLSAVALFAISAFAAPVPGLYVGVVTVTKNLGNNFGALGSPLNTGMSSVYTLRAQAQVFPDGSITILPTVVESPTAAADPSRTFIRATPVGMTIPESPFAGSDYAIDGQFPAYLTIIRNTFELYYETERPIFGSIDLSNPNFAPSNPYTSFKLRFVLKEKYKPLVIVLPQAAN